MSLSKQRVPGQAVGDGSRGRRLPPAVVLVIVFGTCLIVCFWLLLKSAERKQLGVAVRITAEQVQHRLEAWFTDRISLVEYLALQHGTEAAISSGRLEHDVLEVIRFFPGFQALNYIGPDGVIRRIIPREGNETALGKDLHRHPDPSVPTALARAVRTRRMTSTEVITLLQGGRGFATYRPLYDRQGNLTGFLNAVFRIDALVDACLSESALHDSYRYALTDGEGHSAYVSPGGGDPAHWPGSSSLPLRIVDREWQLQLAPTPATLARSDVWADEVMGLVGLLALVALGWALQRLWQRQQLLRESQARYRYLVDHQVDLLVRITPEGRVLFASPSYQRLLGLDECDVSCQPFVPFVHEDDSQRLQQALRRATEPPYSVKCEHRIFTEDGVVWLSWQLQGVVDATGRVTSLVGVGRDVTERKELQQRLQIIQRRQLVGQLATGIVQDMETNLQVMLGHTEFALDNLNPGPARGEIEVLRRDIDRSSRLIRRLLSLSREQPPRPRDLHLGRLVTDLERLLQRTLGREITLNMAVEGTPVVHADPDQCEQVVLNLCLAAHRLAAAGTVSVTVREVALTPTSCRQQQWARPGQFVELQVAVDGPPLDQESVTRLFDPFFAIHRLGEDVGVGLATIFTIVRHQDGLIHVESGQERGTVFTVLLPAVGGASERAGRQQLTAIGGTKGTVLVAGMETAVRDHVVRILERAGHEVLVARDGEEAVALVAGQPDRIEVAVVGPQMVSHADRLRGLAPALALVLLVGGTEEESSLTEARVLSIPFTREELLQAVTGQLTRRDTGPVQQQAPVSTT